VDQLNQLAQALADQVDAEPAQRARGALSRHLAKGTTR
jgi:hypothetical protein